MEIKYVKPSECYNFLSWFYFEWNYICAITRKRETGFRLFGFVFRTLTGCTCGEDNDKGFDLGENQICLHCKKRFCKCKQRNRKGIWRYGYNRNIRKQSLILIERIGYITVLSSIIRYPNFILNIVLTLLGLSLIIYSGHKYKKEKYE